MMQSGTVNDMQYHFRLHL